jgi:hypothetical protein
VSLSSSAPSIVITQEAGASQLMPPALEAPISTPQPAEPSRKVLANQLMTTLDLLAKLNTDHTNQVGPLPTRPLQILVEVQGPRLRFWERLFSKKKTEPHGYTTHPAPAWLVCDENPDKNLRAIYIGVANGIPYVLNYRRSRGVRGYVQLTPSFLEQLPIRELQRLIEAAREQYQHGSQWLDAALYERLQGDAAR